MNYNQQLVYKHNEVFNHLKRIGKIELPDFEPILGSKEQFFYRNKMEFGFSNAQKQANRMRNFLAQFRHPKRQGK